MATSTRINYDEFRKLQDAAEETVRYELDEGELIVTPSPTPLHNIVRYRLRRALTDFVLANNLGIILDETDFRLAPNVVRKPGIAYLAKDHLKTLDLRHTPVEVPPTLAIEIISPGNLARDMAKKVRQYLASGSHAVWLVFPDLRLIEIHDRSASYDVSLPGSLREQKLFGGIEFVQALTTLFDENPTVN